MSTALDQKTLREKQNAIPKEEIGIQEAFLAMNNNGYFQDYLRFLIRRNQDAADLYNYAAQSAKGTDVQAFFSDIADIKWNGAEYLYRLHKSNCLFMFDKVKNPIDSYLKMSAGLKYVATIVDASFFVLKNELNDLQIYKHLAEQEEDPSTKNLFFMVVKLQKSHIKSVLTELSLDELETARQKYAGLLLVDG